MKLKIKQPKVVKRLIEAFEEAKNQQDARAMADIAIQIENVQRSEDY